MVDGRAGVGAMMVQEGWPRRKLPMTESTGWHSILSKSHELLTKLGLGGSLDSRRRWHCRGRYKSRLDGISSGGIQSVITCRGRLVGFGAVRAEVAKVCGHDGHWKARERVPVTSRSCTCGRAAESS